jgi:hypothetical protein
MHIYVYYIKKIIHRKRVLKQYFFVYYSLLNKNNFLPLLSFLHLIINDFHLKK